MIAVEFVIAEHSLYASGECRLVKVGVDDRDCAYGQPYA